MADLHHHGHGTTVVGEDREGPATALIVVLAVLLIAFLVWFFAFSGVVFDSGGSGGGTNVTNVEDNPGGDTGNAPGNQLPTTYST